MTLARATVSISHAASKAVASLSINLACRLAPFEIANEAPSASRFLTARRSLNEAGVAQYVSNEAELNFLLRDNCNDSQQPSQPQTSSLRPALALFRGKEPAEDRHSWIPSTLRNQPVEADDYLED
mmetsp:Transcript_7591/g.13195  ORF Transcript_7591/g.13195 Transcript_7591/m.13195 type:complete len:126 (-) Transcript_7591:362-739(-)